jgi:FkbM family methyltransferase
VGQREFLLRGIAYNPLSSPSAILGQRRTPEARLLPAKGQLKPHKPSTPIAAAVCNEDRSATFYADNLTGAIGSLEHSDDSFIAKHHGRAPSEVTVKCLSLDSMSNRVDPDFMKIDVEGAENVSRF